jgi:hypothetical protein
MSKSILTVEDADACDLIAFLSRWRKEHPDPDEQFEEAVAESRQGVGQPREQLSRHAYRR